MKLFYYVLPILSIMIISFLYSKNNRSQIDISNLSKSFYDYTATSIDGEVVSMADYKGKVVLIVNVASKCGFTPQYKGLQSLSEKYKEDLVVLGFPSNNFLWQEPGKNDKIKQFCQTQYGVTFPMFEKVSVKKNKNQHPIFSWLSSANLNGWNNNAPSWNFYKYLIDKEGKLVDIFSSKVTPMSEEILKYLEK